MNVETPGQDGKAQRSCGRNRKQPLMGPEFRYHLLSIGVNRESNGATVRSAERDAFGMSWTFGQLGYWRAARNRCLTGGQPTPAAIEAHLSHCASIADLDLLMIYWSG